MWQLSQAGTLPPDAAEALARARAAGVPIAPGTDAGPAARLDYIPKTAADQGLLDLVHTGQDVTKIQADAERDRWFTADEAKEYGLIDKVILKRGEIR